MMANELLKDTKRSLVLQPVMLKYNKNSHLSESPLITERAGVALKDTTCFKQTFGPTSNGQEPLICCEPPDHQVFFPNLIV